MAVQQLSHQEVATRLKESLEECKKLLRAYIHQSQLHNEQSWRDCIQAWLALDRALATTDKKMSQLPFPQEGQR